MGSNPSQFRGDTFPVENVSWNDCQEFIKKMNNLHVGSFRLPTEIEWEYACRAGSQSCFFWGENSSLGEMDNFTWYNKNAGYGTHPVGEKFPNNFGLYDMTGNVWEWCQDLFDLDPDGFLFNSAKTAVMTKRCIRGGSFNANPGACRPAARAGHHPEVRSADIGLRLVMDNE